MTYRSSSTQFILTLGMSTLFLAVPCPPAPIIRGSLGRCGTRRIGGGTKSKEGIGRVLKPAHGARSTLSQTRVLYALFYQSLKEHSEEGVSCKALAMRDRNGK